VSKGLEEQAQLGQDVSDLRARSHGDDHHRDSRVAAKEARPFADAVRGAVASNQDGRPGDSTTVQQVADRYEGEGPSARSWRPR
jgi:hypothetical protein